MIGEAEGGERSSAPPQATDRFGSGRIRGVVRIDGEPPPPRLLNMTGDRACHSDEAVEDPRTIVSELGGVANAFVYVKRGVDGRYTPPDEPVSLDQRGCMFGPRVFGIQVGQPLRIINSDQTLHNVHSLGEKNDPFNVSQPRKDMTNTETFAHPEVMVRLRCHVHGWMEAYCGVLPHPFFGVTNEDGQFEIARLPPGEYVVECWHELWGRREAQVTVQDADTQTLDFVYARKQ